MTATLEEHLQEQHREGDQPITVLLVDDDPDCRLMLRDAIAASGVRTVVHEAGTAEEGWKFLNREGIYANAPMPALVYLDIEMPGVGGIELLKAIKQTPEFQHITVVMMTGVSDREQLRNAAACGANSYTIKPANAERFLQTVIASTNYWLTIHQYPEHHLPPEPMQAGGMPAVG